MAKPLKQGISHLFTITRINGSTKSRDRSVFLSRDLLQLDAAENSNRHQYHDERPARELDLRREVARFRYRIGRWCILRSQRLLCRRCRIHGRKRISIYSRRGSPLYFFASDEMNSFARILFMSDTLSTLKYQQLNRLSS